MTAKQLHQYRALCKEIADIERRIEKQRREQEETVSDVVQGSQACFPFTRHRFIISGRTTILDEGKLARLVEKCEREKEEIQVYIDEIDDSITRQIFRYRHLDGLSWRAIAFRIGGGNTEDGVRKIHDRYIKKH